MISKQSVMTHKIRTTYEVALMVEVVLLEGLNGNSSGELLVEYPFRIDSSVVKDDRVSLSLIEQSSNVTKKRVVRIGKKRRKLKLIFLSLAQFFQL
jgi:hypothetical protein